MSLKTQRDDCALKQLKSSGFNVSDDHSRVKLKAEINPSRSDYINASTIVRTPIFSCFSFD